MSKTKKKLTVTMTNLSARKARKTRNALVQYLGVETKDISLDFHNNTVDSTKGPSRKKHGQDTYAEWLLTTHLPVADVPSDVLPEDIEIQRKCEWQYRIVFTGGDE